MPAAMQASTLETLVNLVAAGYGTTLLPSLAADSFRRREIVLRPLAGKPSRTIRLVSRPGFPRPQALRVLEKIILKAVSSLWKSRANLQQSRKIEHQLRQFPKS
jgi:LysR family hydrogen peroxide-inducible transcriptional activator